jgi:predicted Zn-dependent protease
MLRGLAYGLMLVLGISCVTTPVTNRQQVNFIPDSQMNAMGAQAFTEILAKEKISTNQKLTDIVVKIGKRIAKASGQDYAWEFKLIDAPKMVNAFCLPGGKVAVYTGIIPVAKTEAGLAAIIGHEVAHAVLRHGAERASQGMMLQLGVAAAGLTFDDPRYRGLIAAALGVGLQFGVMLPFSRKHESEADFVGIEYMAKAGYDPVESVDLWKRMAKAGGGKVPEILSTHPDPERRAEELKLEVRKVEKYYDKSDRQPPVNL